MSERLTDLTNAEPAVPAISALSGASRLGLGCYRMSSDVAEHRAAMERAIELGCTLIDTASNYADGSSEELIGQVLSDTPSRGITVITKAGYVSSAFRDNLHLHRVPVPHAVTYSLAPDVLKVSLDVSLRRLRSNRVDVLLLHNPEHLFNDAHSDVDSALRSAFYFLMEQVSAGTICYFGVSSNKFTLNPRHGHGQISLPRLVSYAQDLDAFRAFRVVQMPCNLIERDMVESVNRGEPSVQQFAAQSGLVTVANRPINALSRGQPLRLAQYSAPEITSMDSAGSTTALDEFVNLVSGRLAQIEGPYECRDFPVMRFLKDMWFQLRNPELVDHIFANQVQPFVFSLYDGNPSSHACLVLRRLHQEARAHALSAISHRAAAVLEEVTGAGARAHDARPLSFLAAAFPLCVGFDHVLVGMRSRHYVDELASLFG